MFDLKELEAFASVMQSGSLTQSAKLLNLPKSTLSRRIHQLEKGLDQALLRRESNRLLPTEAGLLFHDYSQGILNLACQGRTALEELCHEVSGELNLYCHDALLRSWFGPTVTAYLSEYTGVNISLQAYSKDIDPEMNNAIGICVGEEPVTSLRTELIGTLRQGVYAQPQYLSRCGRPQHPQDLKGHKWVNLMGNPDKVIRFSSKELGEYDIEMPTSRLKVDRFVLQSDAIVKGTGLGLLPHWLVKARLRHHPGSLELCMTQWSGPDLNVYILYPFGQKSKRVRSFIDYVRRAVPAQWQIDG
ncbi:LysR family transcriptional regulator [Neptunomonas phycophila]|nr:LysR family transcriptional regulator [Neptunomonas phycophila]MBT3146323.1 LysR family transcriptional regulator [Neptunomonas phycophila]